MFEYAIEYKGDPNPFRESDPRSPQEIATALNQAYKFILIGRRIIPVENIYSVGVNGDADPLQEA